ncbi:Fe-S-cluster-containing hydrogenase [Enterovirga aerilata]|uniref:4Fe-4S dicluster domain-containing protein n=1 Tax=Enterovirga aerilata TaxID=2730920 RepID=A0A849I6K5_9HYPH|nr:Fe-S-cluster-containing hydrogenase [Enterovirga sp. DB1703]NNM71720.1 4Fe-4S dicluster domain-containing protein [Enterovirga sp. DB1703]
MPPLIDGPPRGQRDLEELADAAEGRRLVAQVFPDIAQAGPVDRRTLLQLVAASLAALGMAGCDDSRDGSGHAPLLSQPRRTPGLAPGEPVVFATTLELDGYGRGVLATAVDGRAIRIDGNPLHPASLGAADVFAQAEILALYDPDRSHGPVEKGEPRNPAQAQAELARWREALLAASGRGTALLVEPSASPTLRRLLASLRLASPEIALYAHAPLVGDQAARGAERAFGRAADIVCDLAHADVVLAVGGDLFGTGPGHLRHAMDWSARRRAAERPLPRLFCVETAPSLAGARADRRIALRPSGIAPFLGAVFSGLDGQGSPDAHPAAVAMAEALRQAGPAGLVTVGPEQPPEIHALAHAINLRLGAFGRTVRAIAPVLSRDLGSIAALAEAIAAGRVSRLAILGGNPAYDAPADLEFVALLRRVPETLHLGLARDETAALCRWHLPAAHPLESFGDSRAFDGTISFRQPAVRRDGFRLSAEEVLGAFLGDGFGERERLAATWRSAWGDDSPQRFEAALAAGVVEGSAAEPVKVTLSPDWDRQDKAPAPGEVDIVFAPDPCLHDGRYANSGWLQELPKPLTKQVWGNAALIGPDTAKKLGLERGDHIEVGLAGRVLRCPVWPLRGHAEGALTLPLGYGRRAAGRVGTGIGFDAFRIRGSQDPWISAGTLSKAAGRDELTTTQHHASMEGRQIVRTVDDRDADLQDRPPEASLYPAWPPGRHAWGMAIDLDACIGCNACVIACQSENNIPVVGPEEAARGREMHWLRVDGYEVGDPSAPATAFQPVPCMHCENAPCEVVCPVNATVHSSEGLNDMVYNRCIGTRTCSNNCPYKVRRFNFSNPRSGPYATPEEAHNPQVTVRSRGVMEKCTFCVQRIAAARIAARMEDRPIRDGEITTACASVCPTRAIVFGDLADAESAVSRARGSGRNYALLGELNTRPRTTYLARVVPGGDGP